MKRRMTERRAVQEWNEIASHCPGKMSQITSLNDLLPHQRQRFLQDVEIAAANPNVAESTIEHTVDKYTLPQFVEKMHQLAMDKLRRGNFDLAKALSVSANWLLDNFK